MADQLILPGAVPIDIRDHGGGCTGIRGRGIGVDLLLSDIPPGLVGIGHRLIGELVVLPDQLVGAVVLVGDGSRPLSDRGYVPVVVVGVCVGIVAAVLVRGQQGLKTLGLPNGAVIRPIP